MLQHNTFLSHGEMGLPMITESTPTTNSTVNVKDTDSTGTYLLHAAPTATRAAYIYIRSGTSWSLQSTLTPSDGNTDDFFGSSVALSNNGTYACIPAYNATVSSTTAVGAVYVFVRSGTTWSQQAKIVPPSIVANDYMGWYGCSVSDDGSYLIVNGFSNSYIFTRSGTTWSYQTTLRTGSNLAAGRISGDGITAFVGIDDSTAASHAGAAVIYTRSGTTWTEQQTVYPDATLNSNSMANAYFGRGGCLSTNGSVIAIHAPMLKNGSNYTVGGLYVFSKSGATWTKSIAVSGTLYSLNNIGEPSITAAGDIVAAKAQHSTGTTIDNGGNVFLHKLSDGSTWEGVYTNATARLGTMSGDGMRGIAWGSASDYGQSDTAIGKTTFTVYNVKGFV